MRIVTVPDRVLTRVAKPVDRFDSSLSELAGEMVALMEAKGGLGLAAPQVGVSRRLFVMRSWPQPFINPEIISHGDEEEIGMEGCLSIPGELVAVRRWKKVKLVASDLEGHKRVFKLRNRDARCAQHELDHLDGKLITDHVE